MPGAGPWLRSQDRSPVATRALSRGRPTSCGPQVIYCEIRDIGTWFSRSLRRLSNTQHTTYSVKAHHMEHGRNASAWLLLPSTACPLAFAFLVPRSSPAFAFPVARAPRSGFVSITLHTPRPTRRVASSSLLTRDTIRPGRTGFEISIGGSWGVCT